MTAASARDGMTVGRAARGDIAALALICARGLTILSVVLLFCVSSMLLQHVGYNYETPGGSPLEKMHPGTLVAALAALALLASRARPFAFIAEILARHLGMAAFVCVWCVLLAYLLLVQKSPFTAIIDTFLLPVIMFVLIGAQRAQLERPLEIFLHAFLAINCLLGLFEVASGWRLVPYVANGVPILDDWRATAILGHPLANASITGCYLLVLMLGGGERLRGAPRAAMLCLTVAAMVAFGGRAATALLFLFAGPVAFIRFLTAIAYGRATAFRAALIAFALFAAPILLMVLAEAGAFDQFISRFIDDRGSAQARVAMFDLFDYLSWRDILIGPDPALIDTLKQIEGLEFGIESFWVSSILAYGLIMAGIVYVSLFFFCRDLARATRPAAWMLLGYFFAVASTSVSLSAKSAILAIVVILAMVLLPPRRKRAPGAA